MRKALVAVWVTLALSNCVPSIAGRHPEIEPLLDVRGDSVGFSYRREVRSGEVLGFRNDTTFILANNEIYAVKQSELRSREKSRVDWAQPSMRPHLDELRRRARYPIGITPELERVLLARLNQAQVHR